MSVETLRAVNGIGSRAVVPVGHTLLVPAQQPSREAAETLTHAVFTTVPSGRTFYHVVQRGDTLQRVAARYGVTAADIKQWNGIVHEHVQTGTRLRVTSDVVPVAKVGGRSKRAMATRGATTTRSSKVAAQPTATKQHTATKPQPAKPSKTAAKSQRAG